MALRIGIIGGAGYVGLTTGACFARDGHQVVCLDIDKQKVDGLNKGVVPIYEEGMEFLINDGLKRGRLSFTTDFKAAVESSQALFIALPTPTMDGEADLSFILRAVPDIAKNMDGHKFIVTKSTVPPGSGAIISAALAAELKRLNKPIDFDYVSNPEFLRQGSAVADLLKPDRIVVGAASDRAVRFMDELYHTFKVRGVPIRFMSVMEAETVKYAANSFLAVKISFANSIANLCDSLNLDAYHVLEAWADDRRIGRANMHPGPGFGGSCFPKDTQALVTFARKAGSPQDVVEAAIEVNHFQRLVLSRKVEEYFREKGLTLAGLTFAVLGLSFKAETDDTRDSSAIDVIHYLVSKGALIRGYDPAANEKAKAVFSAMCPSHGPDLITQVLIVPTLADAVKDVDAVLIMTDWNEFKQASLKDLMSSCRHPVIFDARNLFIRNPEKVDEMKAMGIEYVGIGTRLKLVPV